MSCAEPTYMHMSRSFRMLEQHTLSLEQESERLGICLAFNL